MIITLTNTEVAALDMIAHLRYIETSRVAKENIQTTAKTPREIVRHGVYSEYAVAKYLNVFFDMNCDVRKFGADLISARGTLIDVKSTTKEGGPLNATKNSVEKPADIFVCTEIDDDKNQVKIVGYVDRNDFLIDENLHDIGNGFYYCLPQTFLKKFNGFKY